MADTNNDFLNSTISEILSSANVKNNDNLKYQSGLVDIMTFCENKDYLDLPGNNFKLFISQRVVLKCFYMGTPGNEKLFLSKEEWGWLYEKKQNKVIEKLQKKERGEQFRFSELTLVLGRRASKTVLASIIASYEAYKLSVINNGDPYTYFQIPFEHKIAIINVATSREQAKILFSEIESRIRNAPFFANRIANSSSSEIRLYTDLDLRKIRGGIGNIKPSGSISILCGHSNPKSLRGYAVFCLIFDELAFYDEGGKVSAKDFYNALQPSVTEFASSAIDKKPHGIIVEISSPGPTSGFFYKLYQDSLKENNMLSFKAATWDFNPRMDYNDPELKSIRDRDPDMFAVEYGAEWPEGSMYGQYFPKELVEKIFEIGLSNNVQPQEKPYPGGEYFFHIDPGLTASRYVCVCIQKVMYRDFKGVPTSRSILAFVKIYTPLTAMGLEYDKIDEDILALWKLFRPRIITYDQWDSNSSISFLTKNGVIVKQTSFNRSYKSKIYQNLRDLMSKPECGLFLFEHEMLRNELINLKYRPSPRGISIGADKRGECPTDDIADCLAGATYMSCGKYFNQLPRGALVYTGMR